MYAVIGVPREPTSLPPLQSPLPLSRSPFELPGASDEVDRELLDLPDPPRRQRTFTIGVLSLGILAALAMVITLRHDVAYALARSRPANVGDLRVASGATLEANENGLVAGDGLLGAAGGLRYERPLRDDTFRALPVAGRTDVWVEVRVPPGEEGGRWEPPRAFVGRLERFDAVGPSHSGLRAAIEATTQAHVPRGAFLLVDGEDPTHARWAIVVAAIFLGFAAGNALAIARIVRKVQ
jgi:hypothetical protein